MNVFNMMNSTHTSEIESNSYSLIVSGLGIYNKTIKETTTLNELSTILLYFGYSFLVVGLMSNITVCLVIMCCKSMHTVTNCYLFSLSISDLLLLINGTIHDAYVLNKAFVQPEINIFYALTEVPMCVSIATVTAFALERYLAICRPLYTYKTSEVRRTVKLLIILWIVSFLIVFPRGLVLLARPVLQKAGMTDEIFHGIMFYSHCVNAILFLAVPVIFITVSYILIGLEISKSNRIRRDNSNDVDANQKNNLITMGIIIIVTIMCWLPVFSMEMIDSSRLMKFHNLYVSNPTTYLALDEFSNLLLRLSPVINPIIYSAMSSKFRKAVKEFVIGCNRPCTDWSSRLDNHSDIVDKSSSNSSTQQFSKF